MWSYFLLYIFIEIYTDTLIEMDNCDRFPNIEKIGSHKPRESPICLDILDNTRVWITHNKSSNYKLSNMLFIDGCENWEMQIVI
jgi:hypothetical protein